VPYSKGRTAKTNILSKFQREFWRYAAIDVDRSSSLTRYEIAIAYKLHNMYTIGMYVYLFTSDAVRSLYGLRRLRGAVMQAPLISFIMSASSFGGVNTLVNT
jgi:hypothetical protein